MDKIYTRTGDKGQTSLYTGERVNKDSTRVEAYGSIDELDSVLGMARAGATREDVKTHIYKIQKDLWMLMADISSLGAEPTINDAYVEELEQIIDSFSDKLPTLNAFIVPGDTLAAGFLDLGRTVSRRCERLMWRLYREGEEVHESNLRYLNRLSDLCYTLMRAEREL